MEVKTTCTQCRQQINDSVNYCENCGTDRSSVKMGYRTNKSEVLDEFPTTAVNKSRQNLIFAGLIVLCSSTIYYFILGVIVDLTDYWELYSTVEPFSLAVTFLGAGVALLIALGMSAGSKKTVAIIFASVYALINLYWFIDRLIPEEPAFDYLQF